VQVGFRKHDLARKVSVGLFVPQSLGPHEIWMTHDPDQSDPIRIRP
jgi:hypothetical protein